MKARVSDVLPWLVLWLAGCLMGCFWVERSRLDQKKANNCRVLWEGWTTQVWREGLAGLAVKEDSVANYFIQDDLADTLKRPLRTFLYVSWAVVCTMLARCSCLTPIFCSLAYCNTDASRALALNE